jgi:hypothetical protein
MISVDDFENPARVVAVDDLKLTLDLPQLV